MKILPDESLPRKLKYDFGTAHEVYTVRDKSWLGQKNGALLKLMIEDGFDILVTYRRGSCLHEPLFCRRRSRWLPARPVSALLL